MVPALRPLLRARPLTVTERVLTTRDLNRSLLARQRLLARSRGPITATLEQVGGLQTQYAPSGYIGLWSRQEGLALGDLTRALERRRVVQATLMRSTIHVVSARDFWPFAEGLRRARREWWTRTHGAHIATADLDRACKVVRGALGDEVRRRDELVDLCRPFDAAGGTAVWNGLPLDLVRAPPSGTWERRRADLFAAADVWLGPSDAVEEEGLQHLLRRYLAGFGPARLNDAANWAGVPLTFLASAAERLGLRSFRDPEGRELLDLPRLPLPAGDTPAPVRFLPTWDATLLVHARRTLVLPEQFRTLIFNTKNPQSLATFLVDGAVSGTWRVERAASRATVFLMPFERLGVTARRALVDEASGLVRFMEPEAVSHAVRVRSPGTAAP